MRIFKNTWFDKFARKTQITAGMLVAAIKRAELGLIDADLGGGLIKMKLVRTSSTTSKCSTTPNASTSETECCRPSNSRINRKSNPRVSTKIGATQCRSGPEACLRRTVDALHPRPDKAGAGATIYPGRRGDRRIALDHACFDTCCPIPCRC